MKRLFCLLLLPLLAFSGCGKKAAENAGAPLGMDIYAFSVGKADCILLSFEGYNVLIDTGEADDGKDISGELAALGINKLDLLVLTHFDKDHIGGVKKLLKNISVDSCIMPDYVRDSEAYQNMTAALEKYAVPCMRLSADIGLELGNASFAFWVSTQTYDAAAGNDNEMSLITALTYKDCKMLFMGDAEGAWLSELCYGGYNITCDLIKMPCHGGWEANITALLAFALPSYAIITDSQKNPASEKTLTALNVAQVNTYRTVEGSVHLYCDGTEITVP